jgi:hypothetical protein
MNLEGTVQKFKLYPKQRGSLLRADVFSDTAKEAMQGQHLASVDLHCSCTLCRVFRSKRHKWPKIQFHHPNVKPYRPLADR